MHSTVIRLELTSCMQHNRSPECQLLFYCTGKKEMFPETPWKHSSRWRDCLLTTCLSEWQLHSTTSILHLGKKKNLQRCSFHISKAACPKAAHLSTKEEFYSCCTSPLCQFCRPPKESLQDNTNPIWMPHWGKAHQLCFEFLFTSSTSPH